MADVRIIKKRDFDNLFNRWSPVPSIRTKVRLMMAPWNYVAFHPSTEQWQYKELDDVVYYLRVRAR